MFYLIFIVLIIFNIVGVIKINKYNKNSEIKTLNSNNIVDIHDELTNMNPLILKNVSANYTYLNTISLKYLLNKYKGYIALDNDKMISFDTFNDNDISIYKNSKCIYDFKLDKELNNLVALFNTSLSCNIKHYIDIFKGSQITEIQQQNNDVCIFTSLEGSCEFYLINPKYHNDIKKNKNIKRWANIVKLECNDILCIPPNWKYYYESENTFIMSKCTSDKYNTYIYNLFK
jgi:hypothetical protein